MYAYSTSVLTTCKLLRGLYLDESNSNYKSRPQWLILKFTMGLNEISPSAVCDPRRGYRLQPCCRRRGVQHYATY